MEATLLELKKAFPFASHEVLARRRMQHRPGLLTIIDNGRITARLAPEGWNIPPQLLEIETEAWRLCRETKSENLIKRGGLSVEGAYVDEGRGVIRVILFLEGEID